MRAWRCQSLAAETDAEEPFDEDQATSNATLGTLRQARRRCADQPHVEFRRLALPGAMPSGQFDLVVLSEVGYYWTLSDLDRFAGWLVGALTRVAYARSFIGRERPTFP